LSWPESLDTYQDIMHANADPSLYQLGSLQSDFVDVHATMPNCHATHKRCAYLKYHTSNCTIWLQEIHVF